VRKVETVLPEYCLNAFTFSESLVLHDRVLGVVGVELLLLLSCLRLCLPVVYLFACPRTRSTVVIPRLATV
jgi:hypothetical protein